MGLKEVISQVKYVSTAVNYTIPDDGFNYVVNVDSSGGAKNITLPTGKSGVWVNVVDNGGSAGSNAISIIGTVDGVTTKKITSVEGSIEVYHNGTVWETTGTFDNFFSRTTAGVISSVAPDQLIADAMSAGSAATTFSGSVNDFSNAEANVYQGVSGWGNVLEANGTTFNNGNFNTNATNPYTVTATSEYNATFAAWKPFDGNNATQWEAVGTPSDQYLIIDLGSAKTFVSYRLNLTATAAPRRLTGWTVKGSTDGISFTPLHTVAGSVFTDWTSFYTISPPGSYRYYQLVINANNGDGSYSDLAEIDFREGTLATTTNTFQSRLLTAGASSLIDMSSLDPEDENGVNLVDGDILLEYSIDAGSNWSSQIGLTATRALADVTTSAFWLRVEMVGAKLLGTIEVLTVASYSTMQNGEMTYLEAGVQKPIHIRYNRVGVEETTTARTIGIADLGKTVYCSNAAATTITFPDTLAGTNFNFEVEVISLGAGGVTIAASGTATVAGNTALTQYERTKIVLTGTNTFICT